MTKPTAKEHVNWFYEKFVNGLEGFHPQESIIREKLDQEMLIKLIINYDCKSVLEIGTWEGQTGLLLWLHPKIKKFKAIDVHKDMDVKVDCTLHYLKPKEFIGHYLKDTNTKIDFIDTMKWAPLEWKKKNGHFDMIFIDANHNYDHVKNDTLKALQLKPKIIVWHDIGHANQTDQVPIYLKQFLKDYPDYKIKVCAGTEIGYLVL